VFLTDGNGRKIGEKIFKHSGEGLAEMAAWLLTASGAGGASQVHIAIEVPHGPVVETLIERGFMVHAIDPKQMGLSLRSEGRASRTKRRRRRRYVQAAAIEKAFPLPAASGR